MNLQQLPRAAVCTWLRAARMPVTAVARFNGDDGKSPLVVAFDAFEARVKRAAGSVLRDHELAQEGRAADAKRAKPQQGTKTRAKTGTPKNRSSNTGGRARRNVRPVVDVDASLDADQAARHSS